MNKLQKLQKLTKKQREFLEIHSNTLGVVSASCKKANISRQTFYRWVRNPLFLQEVNKVKEELKDFGEASLFKLMKEGNTAAVIFFNKTKNKDRGYVEKQELEHTTTDNGFKLIIEAPDGSTVEAE